MKSEPITFLDIFSKKLENQEDSIKGIEIPIIQRDYAQGRETKEVTRIRNNFVDAILKSLNGGSEDAIKLDFVYGNIEEGKLIPLDGQQRLTTLFLLHWYVAKKENIDINDQKILKNFTYRTRFSSRDFCESLVDCNPDFKCEKISNWIIDQNWFMYSWENDPTIYSMLVMIDRIHSAFKLKNNLWDKLSDSTNPPISFYFLPLHDMGLSDSLYIKMNSRGKPLTQFEHFKAEFEKLIKPVSKKLYDEFILKVDISWVDMLWKYRDAQNGIDDRFMKYYRFITESLCYEKDIQIIENDFDLAALIYGYENINAKENLEFLFNSFDCWLKIENNDAFFESIFSSHQFNSKKVCLFSEQKNLFALCCKNYNILKGNRRQFSLNNTLFLYAIVQYLIHQEKITEDDFTTRIRIVRNLIFNSIFEIRESRFKALLNDVKSIITKGEINLNTNGFNVLQKKEELEKIVWRKNNSIHVDTINRLEDHYLLQGSISIIGLEDIEMFSLRATNFINLFNGEINYNKISNALLSLGDYSQLLSWRYLFGNKNDSTWRDLFTPSGQRKGFEKTQEILFELLDSIHGNYEHYLDELVTTYLGDTNVEKDWRYYFVKYPLMRKGESGFYYWYNGRNGELSHQYEVIMMNTSKSLNGRHWNPFHYALKNDPEFSEYLSLEEYNSPLVVIKTNQKIICKNDGWIIKSADDNVLAEIKIDQENNTDLEDRIDLIKKHLRTVLQ